MTRQAYFDWDESRMRSEEATTLRRGEDSSKCPFDPQRMRRVAP